MIKLSRFYNKLKFHQENKIFLTNGQKLTLSVKNSKSRPDTNNNNQVSHLNWGRGSFEKCPEPYCFDGWPARPCLSSGPSVVPVVPLAAQRPHQDPALRTEEAPPARAPPAPAHWTRTTPPRGAAPLLCRLVSGSGSTEGPGWREHRTPWLFCVNTFCHCLLENTCKV